MKRSKVVALMAIGVGPLTLAACDRRPDCRQGEPQTQDCRPASSVHGGGARGWWPFAKSSSTSDAVATTSGTGETATARGGFGGAGEAASAGGHGGGEGGGGHGGGGGGE